MLRGTGQLENHEIIRVKGYYYTLASSSCI